MQEAGIAHVDFRSLDLPLLHVCEPGRQRAHHQRTGQNVQIPACGPFVGTERAGEFRGVPHLPVVVGGHGPETPERFRGNRDAELGNVPFEKGAGEAASPPRGGPIIGRQVGARKAAPQPQRPPSLRSDLRKVESGQVHDPDPPGERLRNPADQRRRRAPEHQKAGPIVGPIDQDTQRLEQRRRPLDFVDDDQPGQVFQRPFWSFQPPPVPCSFQVEERAAPVVGGDSAGERRFSTLARSGQCHHRMDGELLVHTVGISCSFNHNQ